MAKCGKAHQRGSARETCRCCWSPNPLGFEVPDEIWLASVPAHFAREVLCLACFARFADERLIAWDRDIAFFPVSANSLHAGSYGPDDFQRDTDLSGYDNLGDTEDSNG